MFIANDPYNGGGTHLPDIAVASPVFYEDKVVAYVANIAHHNDVGGRVPGSNAADSDSIYAEGIRIPPVKISRRGSWWRTSSTSSSSTAGSTTSAGET